MEAGGFEPPSRDAWSRASTCLVALVFFRLNKAPNDTNLNRLFRKVLASSARTTDSASPLRDALTRPAGKIGQNGPLIKQPCATDSCQVNLVPGD